MYTELGRAFRVKRRSHGLTQAFVSSAAGISQSMMSRIERGRGGPSLVTLSAVADVLGVDLVATVYPAGSPVRDAGHVRVFTRLKALLPDEFVWRSEVPLPRPGDQRALDAMIVEPRLDVGFELESRLLDAQALTRRVTLKQQRLRADPDGDRAARHEGQSRRSGGGSCDTASRLPAGESGAARGAARQEAAERKRDSVCVMWRPRVFVGTDASGERSLRVSRPARQSLGDWAVGGDYRRARSAALPVLGE